MTDFDDDAFNDRVRAVLDYAVQGLGAIDRAERIQWCRDNNQHGTRMHVDGDLLVFTWGNRPLAMMPRSVLNSDAPFNATFVAELPDTVPDEWPEQ